jgi:hypothetical protein
MMKQGKSISQLAAELERQAANKKDYIAPTERLSMEEDKKAGGVILQGVNGGMKLRTTAHAQMANTLGIPKVYYDKMLAEQPDLLATNVNRWLVAQPARKLIRTLDNEVRAVLSDSYRPLDNIDLAEAVLPKLVKMDLKVESCEVTERRMYLKAYTPAIKADVRAVGDVMYAGIVISNSEIGEGALSLSALDFYLACLNGLISERAMRKAHLGRGSRGQDAIEDAREFFRDETRQADDRAFFLKVQDATEAMFDQKRFDLRINKYREAMGQKIAADSVPEVVELVGRKFGFNEGERKSILSHLIEAGDLSTWGLTNAVTRAAQDVESYDRSVEMETIGGQVVLLKPSDFKVLAV